MGEWVGSRLGTGRPQRFSLGTIAGAGELGSN